VWLHNVMLHTIKVQIRKVHSYITVRTVFNKIYDTK
jgi:hypothetical protein